MNEDFNKTIDVQIKQNIKGSKQIISGVYQTSVRPSRVLPKNFCIEEENLYNNCLMKYTDSLWCF